MYAHLKELRESLGMTQEEFGNSIGVAKTTYNNYEKGEREPRSDFWISVAQKYHVTIDYLMGYSDDPQKTGYENAPAPSEGDEEALSVDEVISAFVNAGLVPEGKDLSDEDLRFLESMIAAIERWFAD